jgi:hypothetical protein
MSSDRDLGTYSQLLDPDLRFEVIISIIVTGERDCHDLVACA